jgi:hypothetical protein
MDETSACDRCSGTVAASTAAAIDELGAGSPLNGLENALAQTAMVLARAIDAEEGNDSRQLAGLSRELRATLKQLADSAPVPDDDDVEDSGPR